MTYTLDVRGDMTFVKDGTGKTVGMVQPDFSGHGWASWLCGNRPFVAVNFDFHAHHNTRTEALSAVGWREGCP